MGRGAETSLDEAESGVGGEGQECGGDCTGEDEAVVDRGYAAEDEFTEAASTYGCGDGGDADAVDGRSPEPRQNEGRGERQFDFGKQLPVGEAEGARYFSDCGVDGADAGVGVARRR